MINLYFPSKRSNYGLTFITSLLLVLFSGTAHSQMPPNIDFSSGNFTNWTCWVGMAVTGTAATGTAFDSAKISSPIGGMVPGPSSYNKSRHFITTGSDTDYYGGFPIVSANGGSYSLRLGTDSPNYRCDRVQYYIHVPASTVSYNLQCEYAIVLQDGGHLPADQPTFQLIAYDSATGVIVPAANNLYIAQYAVPGFLTNRAPGMYKDSAIAYLPWTPTTINLSGMGGKTIILECTALDCSLGGHWGYGYFDVTAESDSLMASIVAYKSTRDSVVLRGPAGYKYYQWYNKDFSKSFNSATDTARTKTVPLPLTREYYNLIITPYAVTGVADTIHTPLLNASVLGVDRSYLSESGLFPNPSTGTLHMNFRSAFEGKIQLISTDGRIVYNTTLRGVNSHVIPTKSFASGMYTLIINANQGEPEVIKVTIH